MQRKTILYIAASLDGFIAKPNDDLSFLALADSPGEDYGYASFMENTDTMVIGRRTYDWLMTQVAEFPYPTIDTYIITHQPQAAIGQRQFYSGDLKQLVMNLKNKDGKSIFINGGAEIVNALLKDDLIDEMILFIFPVLLGDGVRLFQPKNAEHGLHLIDTKIYEKGIVKLHYERTRN